VGCVFVLSYCVYMFWPSLMGELMNEKGKSVWKLTVLIDVYVGMPGPWVDSGWVHNSRIYVLQSPILLALGRRLDYISGRHAIWLV